MKKPVSVATFEGKIVLGVLTLALAGATAGISVWLVNEQNDRAEAAVTETVEEPATTEEAPAETTQEAATTEAETEAATTEAATTETETETETAAAVSEGDPAAGAEVFATAGCAGCHTLADAGTNGTVGPNLDDSQPDTALVVERVTNGQGAMPSFADQLSEQQIADVAAYVSQVAGA